MPRIFVSYRRSDSAGHTGRLYDSLTAEFGEEAVFLDLHAIEAGSDFVERIESSVAECDVLVAVIGDEWLDGEPRRIDDPEDFVHLEIAAGLERDVVVIPALVDAAAMPTASQLPERLKPLARRNAVELSDARWSHDVGRLIASIRNLTGTSSPPSAPPRRRFPGRIVAGLAAVAALAVVAVLLLGGGEGEPKDPPLTKAEWINQADQICRDTAVYLSGQAQGLDQSDAAALEQFTLDVTIPATQDEFEQIDALVAPAGDEEVTDAILAAYRRGLDQVIASSGAVNHPYREAFQLAGDYGLRICNGSS